MEDTVLNKDSLKDSSEVSSDEKLIAELNTEVETLIAQREKLKEQYHQTIGALSATESLIKVLEKQDA